MAKDKYFGEAAEGLRRAFVFGGAAGVAFFFVLSGFIIVLIHGRDVGHPDRLMTYLRKRLVRIYPTYLLIFAAVYEASWFVPSLRDGMPTNLGVLVKSMLLVPQDPALVGGTGAPVLVGAWSLQYELIFYAVVGLAIVHRALCALGVVALSACAAWQTVGGTAGFPASFFANELMLLFAMGASAALLARSAWRMARPGCAAVIAGMAFLAVGMLSVWRNDPHNAWFNLGYGVFGAIAIVALTQAERLRPVRIAHHTTALLGDASYALYLIHFPLIAILCKLAVAARLRGVVGSGVAFMIIAIVCVAVAVASGRCCAGFHAAPGNARARRRPARVRFDGSHLPGRRWSVLSNVLA